MDGRSGATAFAFTAALSLSGCSSWSPGPMVVCPQATKLPEPPEPSKPIIIMPSGQTVAPAPPEGATPETADVIAAYRATVAKEADIVTTPQVTPDAIRQILAADRAARVAVLRLTAQGKRPQPAMLDDARARVQALADLLANAPGEPH